MSFLCRVDLIFDFGVFIKVNLRKQGVDVLDYLYKHLWFIELSARANGMLRSTLACHLGHFLLARTWCPSRFCTVARKTLEGHLQRSDSNP
jgi:hypothetical protein